jgi:hypothetical protein
MIAFGVILFFTSQEKSLTYTLLGIGVGVLTIFWIRLEMGYFDYMRKIHAFLKNHLGI